MAKLSESDRDELTELVALSAAMLEQVQAGGGPELAGAAFAATQEALEQARAIAARATASLGGAFDFATIGGLASRVFGDTVEVDSDWVTAQVNLISADARAVRRIHMRYQFEGYSDEQLARFIVVAEHQCAGWKQKGEAFLGNDAGAGWCDDLDQARTAARKRGGAVERASQEAAKADSEFKELRDAERGSKAVATPTAGDLFIANMKDYAASLVGFGKDQTPAQRAKSFGSAALVVAVVLLAAWQALAIAVPIIPGPLALAFRRLVK